MRASFLVLGCWLLGCVSLPHARLVIGQGTREVVAGPVVCGPVGFRTVPMQSRWGEYVRVTVSSAAVLRGTVMVHANGVAQEPRSWSMESGALVIDARFPNEDVDRRFALERERPIDITLAGLEVVGAGSCEGAVFTVEHGALVPSVDERAWVVELERRGGPELAARRELARVEAEARRQAHYAQWALRVPIVPSDEIRQAHYARFSPLPGRGEGQGEGMAIIAPQSEVAAAAGSAEVSVPLTSACASGPCPGAAEAMSNSLPSRASAPSACTRGACPDASEVMSNPFPSRASMASPAAAGTVAFEAATLSNPFPSRAAASGSCPLPVVAGSAAFEASVSNSSSNSCAGGSCPVAVIAGSGAFEVSVSNSSANSCASGACPLPVIAGSAAFESSVSSSSVNADFVAYEAPAPVDSCSNGSCSFEVVMPSPFFPSPQPSPRQGRGSSLLNMMFRLATLPSSQPPHGARPVSPR
jgi:hypothetical protein